MKKIVLSAAAVASLAGSAMAQTYGNVEFRWVERALGVSSGDSFAAGARAAAASVDNVAVGTSTDATYHLILQARVIPSAQTGADVIGFSSTAGNLVSSDAAARSGFAGVTITSPAGNTSKRNAASASSANAGYNTNGLPAYPAGSSNTLPSFQSGFSASQGTSPRGIFAPYRFVADVAGANNGPAIGEINKTLPNSIEGISISNASQLNPFFAAASVDPDTGDPIAAGPYYKQFQFIGLNSWTPIYYAVVNLTDTATARDIAINFNIQQVRVARATFQAGPDGQLGTSDDVGVEFGNPDSGNSNNWAATFSPIPTYTISVTPVPAPGATALLGLGGLLISRRRR